MGTVCAAAPGDPPSETDSDLCLVQVSVNDADASPLKEVKAEPEDDDEDEMLCFFVDRKGGPRGPHIKAGRLWLAPGVLRRAVASCRRPAPPSTPLKPADFLALDEVSDMD